MAHRIEPEPPLDWLYLAQCLACLALLVAAVLGLYVLGWMYSA